MHKTAAIQHIFHEIPVDRDQLELFPDDSQEDQAEKEIALQVMEDELAVLKKFVKYLTPNQREIFHLYYEQGLNTLEIARLTHRCQPTIWKCLYGNHSGYATGKRRQHGGLVKRLRGFMLNPPTNHPLARKIWVLDRDTGAIRSFDSIRGAAKILDMWPGDIAKSIRKNDLCKSMKKPAKDKKAQRWAFYSKRYHARDAAKHLRKSWWAYDYKTKTLHNARTRRALAELIGFPSGNIQFAVNTPLAKEQGFGRMGIGWKVWYQAAKPQV